MTDPVEIAREVAGIAADALAANIAVLDLSKISSIADVFVLCSADNVRQLNALHQNIVEDLRKKGVSPRRSEGAAEAGWILLDYDDVVVHLMTEQQRAFYRLEDVWKEAPKLLVIQ